MIVTSFSDLSRQNTLAGASRKIKSDMSRLTEEMASGQVQDPAKRLRGDLGRVKLLDHSIARAIVAQENLTLVQSQFDAKLTSVTQISQALTDLAERAIGPDLGVSDARLATISAQFGTAIETIVGALNTRFAGRSLFAGTAVDSPAVVSADMLKSQVGAIIPTGASYWDANDSIDAWFASTAGFGSNGYLGASADPSGLVVVEGFVIQDRLTANDPALKNALAIAVKGAMTMQAATQLGADQRSVILNDMRASLNAAIGALDSVRVGIGNGQARADQAQTQIQARMATEQAARNDIMTADPYETALALQDNAARLEQLFALTARLSRLSLVNFI